MEALCVPRHRGALRRGPRVTAGIPSAQGAARIGAGALSLSLLWLASASEELQDADEYATQGFAVERR